MKGKLSTWLVVGLTVAAFGVGLVSHALFTSGGGGHDQTVNGPAPQAPVATVESPAQSPAPPPSTTPAKRIAPPPPAVAPPKSSPAVARTISAPGTTHTVTVSVPEPNPLASSSPPPGATTTAPPAAPQTPAAQSPAAPASPSTGAAAEPGEPVVLEPSVRHSLASEAANLLNASASGAETGAAGKVVQELEQCLQLIANSSLPPGVEPPGCNIG